MTMVTSRDELAALYDDDRPYYQALVLRELFNDSAVSRRMAVMLERMRASRNAELAEVIRNRRDSLVGRAEPRIGTGRTGQP
jgi:hypothetical protein